MPIGAAIGVAGVAGAGAQMYGASKAADAQSAAAANANQTLRDQYQQNSALLNPWISGGQNAFDTVNYLTGVNGQAPAGYNGGLGGQGTLTKGFAPTLEQLQQTPGYQFTLDQGLKSTQNSYASKGLASSGAAMKGAADYASGLASNTYQQQFQNYWQQNQNIYNMLTGQSAQGQQAASSLAGQGTQLAGAQSQNTIGAGNAQAASDIAMGNAFASGANSLASGYMSYNLLGQLLANKGANGTSAVPAGYNPNVTGKLY